MYVIQRHLLTQLMLLFWGRQSPKCKHVDGNILNDGSSVMRNLHVWAEAHAHVLLPTSHYSININWFYFCKLDIVKIDRYDEKEVNTVTLQICFDIRPHVCNLLHYKRWSFSPCFSMHLGGKRQVWVLCTLQWCRLIKLHRLICKTIILMLLFSKCWYLAGK